METKVYSEEITKVHKDFSEAAERLYQDAVAILNSNKLPNERKIKRLKALGFVATKEVLDAERKLQKREFYEEIIKLTEYYRIRYPQNKFISEGQVKDICSKYGLIYGNINQYMGFVPENKIIDIEKFKVDDKDRLYDTYYNTGARGVLVDYSWLGIKSNIGVSKKKIFYIIAPMRDFNITGQEVKDYKLLNKIVPDPVVLAPVKGGYLIVTAWGDEASDPIVKNEIEN